MLTVGARIGLREWSQTGFPDLDLISAQTPVEGQQRAGTRAPRTTHETAQPCS